MRWSASGLRKSKRYKDKKTRKPNRLEFKLPLAGHTYNPACGRKLKLEL
jgi:hypothetical protein